MQPLSRVKPDAVTDWGDPESMTRRPALAAKVARCIAQWTEIEIHLGAFLGLILHANEKAAIAMYSSLDSRAAQLRMIYGAAEASVPSGHFDVIAVFLANVIRPSMKERDRFAHWGWGHSDDLPEALLLAEPSYSLQSLMRAVRLHPGVEKAGVSANFDKIYIIRDSDLDGAIKRSMDAKFNLRLAMSTVWDINPPKARAKFLQQLSDVSQIREGLERLVEARKKTPAARPPSPR
jgi:hypothetical protein